jgi:hypothetical protein
VVEVKVLTPHPKKPMPWLVGTDWPEFWRVRLPDSNHEADKVKWCRENCAEKSWGKTFGSEVFYFANLEDATAFRLRWEGAKS